MMNKEREYALLRITAQYTDEARAGQHPQLSNYLAKYPQYANEIADFVAYFHTFEEDVAVGGTIGAATETLIEDAAFPQLLEGFHIAAEAAIDSIMREQESIDVVEKVRSRKEPAADLQRVAEAQAKYQMP